MRVLISELFSCAISLTLRDVQLLEIADATSSVHEPAPGQQASETHQTLSGVHDGDVMSRIYFLLSHVAQRVIYEAVEEAARTNVRFLLVSLGGSVDAVADTLTVDLNHMDETGDMQFSVSLCEAIANLGLRRVSAYESLSPSHFPLQYVCLAFLSREGSGLSGHIDWYGHPVISDRTGAMITDTLHRFQAALEDTFFASSNGSDTQLDFACTHADIRIYAVLRLMVLPFSLRKHALLLNFNHIFSSICTHSSNFRLDDAFYRVTISLLRKELASPLQGDNVSDSTASTNNASVDLGSSFQLQDYTHSETFSDKLLPHDGEASSHAQSDAVLSVQPCPLLLHSPSSEIEGLLASVLFKASVLADKVSSSVSDLFAGPTLCRILKDTLASFDPDLRKHKTQPYAVPSPAICATNLPASKPHTTDLSSEMFFA